MSVERTNMKVLFIVYKIGSDKFLGHVNDPRISRYKGDIGWCKGDIHVNMYEVIISKTDLVSLDIKDCNLVDIMVNIAEKSGHCWWNENEYWRKQAKILEDVVLLKQYPITGACHDNYDNYNGMKFSGYDEVIMLYQFCDR